MKNWHIFQAIYGIDRYGKYRYRINRNACVSCDIVRLSSVRLPRDISSNSYGYYGNRSNHSCAIEIQCDSENCNNSEERGQQQ